MKNGAMIYGGGTIIAGIVLVYYLHTRANAGASASANAALAAQPELAFVNTPAFGGQPTAPLFDSVTGQPSDYGYSGSGEPVFAAVPATATIAAPVAVQTPAGTPPPPTAKELPNTSKCSGQFTTSRKVMGCSLMQGMIGQFYGIAASVPSNEEGAGNGY